MRAPLHYLFAALVMGVYGGHLCPYVATLDAVEWSLAALAATAVAYLLRGKAVRSLVDRAGLEARPRRQYLVDSGLFALVGLLASAFNGAVHHFPLSSAGRLTVSFLILGSFAALDLALERERTVVRELVSRGLDILPEGKSRSLTIKLAAFGSAFTLALLVITFLVATTDIHWVVTEGASDLDVAFTAVVKEWAFLFAVFMALTCNLIVSYSRNLRLYFDNQNNALRRVTQGDLGTRVPVAARDEFGTMAGYTNVMIDSLRQRTLELQQTRDVTILTLASLAETRDNETGAHILRTQGYVKALAAHLASREPYSGTLDPETVELLHKSAPLHDIGKVGVPDSILLKPGRLTDEEFREMKRHPTLGRDALASALDILGENSFLRLAQEIAYTHHEKWDGSGYPQGLAGTDIPLSGRLMALADVYDALISKRIYKPAFPHEKAKALIMEGRGSHFDPDVVDAFLAVEDDFVSIADQYKDGGDIHLEGRPHLAGQVS